MSEFTAATLPGRTPRGSGAAIILRNLSEIRADLAALWPRKEVWRRYIEAAGVSYSQFCRVLVKMIGPAAVDLVEAVKAATKPAPAPAPAPPPAVEQPAPPPPPQVAPETDPAKLKGFARFQAQREIRNAIKDAGEAARINAEAEAWSRLASQPVAPQVAQTAERPAEKPKSQQDYRPRGFVLTPYPDPSKLL